MSSDKLNILGRSVGLGESATIEFEVAKLHTTTPIRVPIIVERSKVPGPVVLLMAGIHGDEVNGVAIVREIIRQKINKPIKGTVICIPVFNIFGYLVLKREFPDGRDLNRMFPGRAKGSLASQFAYLFSKEIIPLVDYVIDYHTGGAMRDNMAQIRCVFSEPKAVELAQAFGAPFIIHSNYIKKSVRETVNKKGKTILLFEGGKSIRLNSKVIACGVRGAQNVLHHLGMLKNARTFEPPIYITKAKWIRAAYSGMFIPSVENGAQVEKGQVLGLIQDPFGSFERKVKAPMDACVFCVNTSPIVNKGNALFHLGYEYSNSM